MFIDDYLDKLSSAIGQLDNITNRLSAVNTNLFGGTPSKAPAADHLMKLTSGNFFSELDNRAERLRHHLQELEEQLQGLEQAVGGNPAITTAEFAKSMASTERAPSASSKYPLADDYLLSGRAR